MYFAALEERVGMVESTIEVAELEVQQRDLLADYLPTADRWGLAGRWEQLAASVEVESKALE